MTGLVNGELHFNLRVWTADHADWVLVRSEVAVRIRAGLAESGIEVPLPPRDLHLHAASTAAAAAGGTVVAWGSGRRDEEAAHCPCAYAPR